MVIAIFFTVLSILTFVFFLTEKRKNQQTTFEILGQLHDSYLTYYLIQNKELADTHPTFFYGIVKSFKNIDFSKTEILKKSMRRVGEDDSTISELLKNEMIDIAENGDTSAKALLGWYVTTCRTIDEVISEPSFELKFKDNIGEIVIQPQNISRSDVSASSNLCVA
jgi:hypothetical protein